jgi:hypothetical protein
MAKQDVLYSDHHFIAQTCGCLQALSQNLMYRSTFLFVGILPSRTPYECSHSRTSYPRLSIELWEMLSDPVFLDFASTPSV